MTPSFEGDGKPGIAGSDVSAMYHQMWTHPRWAKGARPPLNGSVMGTKLGYGTSIVGCQLGGCGAQASGLAIGI